MCKQEAEKIIELLQLKPLYGEGGYFRNTYVSERTLEGESIGSCIYYLLGKDDFSHLHRLEGDEMYHFYMGDPVELFLLDEEKGGEKIILGGDIFKGESLQYLAPAGIWQGSRLVPGGSFALLGTTMWPAYSEASFLPGNRGELLKKFPRWREEILRLTGEIQFLRDGVSTEGEEF